MEHLLKIYKNEIFTCDICDKEYSSKKTLRNHKKTHNVADNFTDIPIKTSLHSKNVTVSTKPGSRESLLKSNISVSTKSSSRKSLLKPNLRTSTKSSSSRSLLKSNISVSTNSNSFIPLFEVTNSVTEHSDLDRQRQCNSTFEEIPIVDESEIDWGSEPLLQEQLDSPQFQKIEKDEALDDAVK